MNKQEEQLSALQDIRSMMERSSRFLSLSGLAGLVIGTFALIGVAAMYAFMGISPIEPGYYELSKGMDGQPDQAFYGFIFADSLTVLVLSLIAGAWMARSKAQKLDQPFWDAPAKRMLINMFIPLAAGGLYSLILIYHGYFEFVVGATLIFYGLALLNASKYTIDDIRYLGMLEIAAGLLASFYIDYGLLIWAFGFGLLHIIYGLVIYLKYEK